MEGKLEVAKHLARTVHDLYFLCGAEIYVALASGRLVEDLVLLEGNFVEEAKCSDCDQDRTGRQLPLIRQIDLVGTNFFWSQ